MEEYLEPFIEELLHINEGGKNKLIDLNAGDSGATYYLSQQRYEDLAAYTLRVIKERRGKAGNTVLRGSAVSGAERPKTTKRGTDDAGRKTSVRFRVGSKFTHCESPYKTP